MYERATNFSGDQMKADVLVDANTLRIRARLDIRRYEIAHKQSARARIVARRTAKIRHRGDPSRARDRQPRSAVTKIAAADDIRCVIPNMRDTCRTLIILITIRRDDQRKPIRDFVRDDD